MSKNDISAINIAIAEFLGNFILSSIIEFNTIYDTTTNTQSNKPFAIMAIFFISITITREISGGHINPAVTLTLYLSELDSTEKAKKFKQMPFYMISQILGSLCASLLGYFIYNKNVFYLTINNGVISSFIMEMLGSTLFYLVILVQADKNTQLTTDKTLSTLMITSGLGGGCALAGNVSGAGLNPAVAIGFNLCRYLINKNAKEIKYIWLFIIAPFCGSFLSWYIYQNYFYTIFTNYNDEYNLKKYIYNDLTDINFETNNNVNQNNYGMNNNNFDDENEINYEKNKPYKMEMDIK